MNIYRIWDKIKKQKVSMLILPIVKIINFYKYYVLSEKQLLQKEFKRLLGYSLNLENPKTLNEKLQWLKLHQRKEVFTLCADKIKVRNYIKEIIGEKYLIPMCFHTYNIDELDNNKLPDYPVIIKTNHDSSGGLIIDNKDKVDWVSTRKHFKSLCKKSYYRRTKEWPYKNIKPGILVEKLLITENGKIPNDYKIHCFNGKVKMIQVDIDRNTDHRRNWYDKNWNSLPFHWNGSQFNGKENFISQNDISKPHKLEKMIAISEKLANQFDYVRVDLYVFEDDLYFGELTFYHGSGYSPVFPFEYDKKLGDDLILNHKIQ